MALEGAENMMLLILDWAILELVTLIFGDHEGDIVGSTR